MTLAQIWQAANMHSIHVSAVELFLGVASILGLVQLLTVVSILVGHRYMRDNIPAERDHSEIFADDGK